MARVVRIVDPADDRLTDYLRLTDVTLRRRREPAAGLFMAEGEKVLRRAVAAGYPVRSLLLAERWLDPLADLVAELDVPVYVVPPEVAEAATGFVVHRGVLAAMGRRPLPTLEQVLQDAARLVVLEDVNDHTNVGAVFRCAAALGMDAVILSPRCADPLYRRAVKVSMGAVFAVPYARMTSWYDGLAQLRAAGVTVLALTPDSMAVPLAEVPASERTRSALVLGSEGSGLSRRWLQSADRLVRIPMARDVDSLNVAAAAAIACYVLGGG